MRAIYQAISWLALAATLAPSLLFFLGRMELSRAKTAMTAATVVWFVVTPLWMGRDGQRKAPGAAGADAGTLAR